MTDQERMQAQDPSAIQEAEYKFPYHYIPAVNGQKVAYSVGVNWAADYLNGIELVKTTVEQLGAHRVCDIGCGDGRLVNELSAACPGVRFNGIDVSSRALTLANLFRRNDNASFFELDLRTSSPPPELLDQDLVTMVEVLEHIPPDEAPDFLRRAYSLVRLGGTLLITVPHANVPVHPKHYRHFTGETLLGLLRTSLGHAVAVDMRYMDKVDVGLRRILAKFAKNRYFSIEPLFQWHLRSRLGVVFVSERDGARVVASITKSSAQFGLDGL